MQVTQFKSLVPHKLLFS